MADQTTELRPGWYVLLYHNVSWEDGPYLRAIGGTCPPDVFRDHVGVCADLGRLVSVQEGLANLRSGHLDEPQFSFWFDDGLSGVTRYAAPILAEYGVTGAQSVCSRFALRGEMFWRFKLGYIHWAGADDKLRVQLHEKGVEGPGLLRHLTIDRFGDQVLAAIDEVYADVVAPSDAARAFELFDTPEDLLALHQSGWMLANHSAAHYPVGAKGFEAPLLEQFLECEAFLQDLTGAPSDHWVLPFDRNIEMEALAPARATARSVVLLRNRVNVPGGDDSDLIYRISVPENDRRLDPALFHRAYENRIQ